MKISRPCPYCGVDNVEVHDDPFSMTITEHHKKDCKSLPVIFPSPNHSIYTNIGPDSPRLTMALDEAINFFNRNNSDKGESL